MTSAEFADSVLSVNKTYTNTLYNNNLQEMIQ